MNYHNITKDDMLNGDGLRVVLWTAGCTHCCNGCQNPQTWDASGGIEFDKAAEDELFEALSKEHISGITFSGGDPLHPFNRETVLRLAKKVKDTLPNKTVWLYTGFLWEEVKKAIDLTNIDVLVDGEFIKELNEWRQNQPEEVQEKLKTLENKISEIMKTTKTGNKN